MDCLKLSNLLKMSDEEFAKWSSHERAKVCRHARLMAACIIVLALALVYLLMDRFN